MGNYLANVCYLHYLVNWLSRLPLKIQKIWPQNNFNLKKLLRDENFFIWPEKSVKKTAWGHITIAAKLSKFLMEPFKLIL